MGIVTSIGRVLARPNATFRDSLALAEQGRAAVQRTRHHVAGGAEWTATSAEQLMRLWDRETETGSTVGLYTATGPARNMLTGLRSEITTHLPIVVGKEVGTRNIPTGLDPKDLLDQSVLNTALVTSVQDASTSLSNIALNRDGGASQAYGVLFSSDGSSVRSRTVTLELETPRGRIPLRLDGPIQAATGIKRLVKPKPGQEDSYLITRTHPSLMVVGDSRHQTRNLMLEDIAPLHPIWRENP